MNGGTVASPASAAGEVARPGPHPARAGSRQRRRVAGEGEVTQAKQATETREAASERVAVWMTRYGEELRRHLTRMLGGEHDAEDVLQEVWVTGHRNPPEDGPGSNVRAWLYRVATNAALDRLAKERRRRCALDGTEPKVQGDAEPPPDAFLSGLDEATRGRIRERVSALPRKQREAVWLRWAEEADYDTIARILECSSESARANVYQGMKKLREELHDVWTQEVER